MSELVKFPKRGGGPPQPPSEPPAELSIVAHVKRTFLVPDTRRRQLRNVLAFATAGSVMRAPLSCRSKPTPSQIAIAQDWRTTIPERGELIAAAEMFESALAVQAKPLEIGAVAAWMVDSYPNRHADVGSVFTDTLELVCEDADEVLSAAVIASAARSLVETSKFLPTASEFLAASMKSRNAFRGAAHRARHLVDLRESALDVLWMGDRLSRSEYGLSDEEGGYPFA